MTNSQYAPQQNTKDQTGVQIPSLGSRKLVFVHGKGGVGKTSVSRAIAKTLSEQKKRVLWVTQEDPHYSKGVLREIQNGLWHLNADFSQSFEEYAALKIGSTSLTRVFTKNKLIRYLAEAAPGIHELVLLGKIWHERNHYDHVVIDMASTGYGLAMFQSVRNFIRLFQNGPLYRDAMEMLTTFRDPNKTGHLIVALPEEMPLRESIDLSHFLKEMFPNNPCFHWVNRVLPEVDFRLSDNLKTDFLENKKSSLKTLSPLPKDLLELVENKVVLELENLKLWRDEEIQFQVLRRVPFKEKSELSDQNAESNWGKAIIEQLGIQILEKGVL